MSAKRTSLRTSLFAGVSVIALAVASTQLAEAAPDRPIAAPVSRAPLVVAAGPIVTMFLEGGLMSTGGGGIHYRDFLIEEPIFGGIKPKQGWTAAASLDYQPAGSPYHLSFVFRYGQSGERTTSLAQEFLESGSTTRARHNERHWSADFMVGRDIGLGGHPGQVKIGLRIADLRATTNVNSAVFESFGPLLFSSAFTQRSKFWGFGPRAAIEGSVLLQGPWSVDYGAGVAVLHGNRELGVGGIFSSSSGWVPNVDASIALSYLVTPLFKVSVGYQIDAYWNVLRTFNSSGNFVNIDRYFHGAFLRATAKY